MTTATAQRRLLEAMAQMESETAGGLDGVRIGLPFAIELANQAGLPQMAAIWQALDVLAVAVQNDMKGESNG